MNRTNKGIQNYLNQTKRKYRGGRGGCMCKVITIYQDFNIPVVNYLVSLFIEAFKVKENINFVLCKFSTWIKLKLKNEQERQFSSFTI